MATHKNLSELFTAIANAIRAVDDTIVGKLKADDFPTIISNIQTGIDTTLPVNEAAAAGDIVSGKKAFVNETLVTGTLAARTSLTFSSVTNATSAVTVKGKHTARFIGNANTDISISVPYTNLASAIGLTAAKIAKGQTIAGISGTFSTPSSGTAITSGSVLSGYTGFVNGVEVKGNIVTRDNTSTNLGSGGGTVTLLSGYYPNEHTVTATAGLQVQTGTVSETDNVYSISTTFKPKGFAMFSDNISESVTRDYVFCLFDLAGTGTVTGYSTHSYKEHLYQNLLSTLGNIDTSANSAKVSNYIYNHDASDKPSDVHFNPFMILDNILDQEKVSMLELGLSNPNSLIVDVYGSTYLLWDALYEAGILDGESAYTDEYTSTNDATFTTTTVVYSNTGATVSVPTTITHTSTLEIDEVEQTITFTREAYCNKMNYIIWG